MSGNQATGLRSTATRSCPPPPAQSAPWGQGRQPGHQGSLKFCLNGKPPPPTLAIFSTSPAHPAAFPMGTLPPSSYDQTSLAEGGSIPFSAISLGLSPHPHSPVSSIPSRACCLFHLQLTSLPLRSSLAERSGVIDELGSCGRQASQPETGLSQDS